MTEWTPKNEQLIREIGDFIEKQMRDVLDPSVSTPATIKHLFNARATGMNLFERATKELGLDLKGDWEGSTKQIIDLCEKNGSDAADKIKRVVPVAKRLADEFGFGPDTKMGKIQQVMVLGKIKKKNIKF